MVARRKPSYEDYLPLMEATQRAEDRVVYWINAMQKDAHLFGEERIREGLARAEAARDQLRDVVEGRGDASGAPRRLALAARDQWLAVAVEAVLQAKRDAAHLCRVARHAVLRFEELDGSDVDYDDFAWPSGGASDQPSRDSREALQAALASNHVAAARNGDEGTPGGDRDAGAMAVALVCFRRPDAFSSTREAHRKWRKNAETCAHCGELRVAAWCAWRCSWCGAYPDGSTDALHKPAE